MSRSPANSALRPRAFHSPVAVVGSVSGAMILHVSVLVALLIGERCSQATTPLIDPRDVMTVSAVALPKQTTRLPQKAERAPDPIQGEVAPEVPVEPPPPTASDMVLEKPDAPKPKGDPKPKDRTLDREALLKAAQREALIKDPNAALGKENRSKTDPNGVDPSLATGTSGVGISDPEFAAYQAAVRDAVIPKFTPLPATVAAKPSLQVIVEVKIDKNGTVSGPRVVQGSGDASFDKAAVLAFVKVGRVPPPPARFAGSVAQGAEFVLRASDK